MNERRIQKYFGNAYPIAAEWFDNTLDANELDCLRAGASHKLMESAGFERCWRCKFPVNDPPFSLTWDDLRGLAERFATPDNVRKMLTDGRWTG